MSTFGKKALYWWDYPCNNRDESIRFHHTNQDLQLEILEKWYPIGMQVNIGGTDIWQIEGYQKKISSYDLILSRVGSSVSKNHRFPLSIKPTKEWETMLKRDIKLGKILK
jgi:hypothetical protein